MNGLVTAHSQLPFVHLGLTGGIASGKSTVARLLERPGVALLDADALSREVVEPGQEVLARIAEVFGPAVLGPEGRLDRRGLAGIVFADPDARKQLEAIIHPAVRHLARERVWTLAGQPEGVRPLVVIEVIPLLYEVGLGREFDAVWVVACAPDTQLRRLEERDGLDLTQARSRLAAQWPIERKVQLADRVLLNDGTLAELEQTVIAALRDLGLKADDTDPVGGQGPYNRTIDKLPGP